MKHKKTPFFSAMVAAIFIFTPFVSTHAQDNPSAGSSPRPAGCISEKKARLTRTGWELMDKCDRVIDFIRDNFSGNAGKNPEIVEILNRFKHEKRKFKPYLSSGNPEIYFCWLIEIMDLIYSWADRTVERAIHISLDDVSGYGSAEAFVNALVVEHEGESRKIRDTDCLMVSGYNFNFRYKNAKKFFMDMWDFQDDSRLGTETLIDNLEDFLYEIKPGAYFLFVEQKTEANAMKVILKEGDYEKIYNAESFEEAAEEHRLKLRKFW